jgi:hypothetical protein
MPTAGANPTPSMRMVATSVTGDVRTSSPPEVYAHPNPAYVSRATTAMTPLIRTRMRRPLMRINDSRKPRPLPATQPLYRASRPNP